MSMVATLEKLSKRYQKFGPPVIVFNKSHSGSRLLASLFIESGVFMGAELNESEDSPDILRLVHYLVENHYPNYAELMRTDDPLLEDLIVSVFDRHLSACPVGARWGWKLCETLYILPILQLLFPGAYFVHLLRDGRDVAFSNHVAPIDTFWKKVYFDTAEVTQWRGLPLTQRAYKKNAHVFNAQHWKNSVSVARHYGSMIGARYQEVRYEALVRTPVKTARALLSSLDIAANDAVLEKMTTRIDSAPVGKHRAKPARALAHVLEVLEPHLQAFGYGHEISARPVGFSWRFWT